MFFIGLGLTLLGGYLFFDSVRVVTGMGIVGRMFGARGGWLGTTSMGIVFVPLLIGVIALFYNATWRWAWYMLYFGIAVITIEILSRIQFFLNTKLTHLLGMMVLFAAGVGLMLRSYRDSGVSRDASGD
jgi:hypothetical protein